MEYYEDDRVHFAIAYEDHNGVNMIKNFKAATWVEVIAHVTEFLQGVGYSIPKDSILLPSRFSEETIYPRAIGFHDNNKLGD